MCARISWNRAVLFMLYVPCICIVLLARAIAGVSPLTRSIPHLQPNTENKHVLTVPIFKAWECPAHCVLWSCLRVSHSKSCNMDNYHENWRTVIFLLKIMKLPSNSIGTNLRWHLIVSLNRKGLISCPQYQAVFLWNSTSEECSRQQPDCL